MSWEYNRRVKYYETDRMGVVHHSNYLRLLEDARMDWLGENLITYSELERLGVIIPCVSASFKVVMRLTGFKGVKMSFAYEIINTDTNELCYKGISSHFFAKDGSYKPYLSFRKDFPKLYQRMNDLVEV